jgi:hypothetical protein
MSFRLQDGQVNGRATLTTAYDKVAEHAGHKFGPVVSLFSMVIVVLIRKAICKAARAAQSSVRLMEYTMKVRNRKGNDSFGSPRGAVAFSPTRD